MDGFDLGSGRDAAGRFVAGKSGNPAGRRPGTRNRKTVLAEALRDGEGEDRDRQGARRRRRRRPVLPRSSLAAPARPRALQVLALERQLDGDGAEIQAGSAAATETDGGETLDLDRADDIAGDDCDTPNQCEDAEKALHFACILPSPATIRGIVATLPAQDRRALAAIVAHNRASAAVAAT